MDHTKAQFIPALSYHWLTRYYDFLTARLVPEKALKLRLLEQAALLPGMNVLDIGCGSGTLALMATRSAPALRVVGLDVDPGILSIAQAKAERAGAHVVWQLGSATRLPFPDASYDRVLSSLMLHHLDSDEKLDAFREVQRVLRPGGSFHLLDFGPPYNRVTSAMASVMSRFEHTADNFRGELVDMLVEVGLEAKETAHGAILFGPIAFVRAIKPNV